MIATLGFLCILTFMVLIMTKRISALVALLAIPLIFGLIGGFGAKLVPMMIGGMKSVAPIAIMLFFAILYFSLMIDAGLFDPLARKIVQMVKGDPVRIIVGTAVLSSAVSLSGDGTTTLMICATALLPIYKRLNINRVYLLMFIGLPNAIMNSVPWGGPVPRIMSSLKLDVPDLFNPLIPAICIGLVFVWILAYYVGKREKVRLGVTHVDEKTISKMVATLEANADNIKRPGLFWVNLAFTVLILGIVVSNKLPVLVVFPIGCALALLINYPVVKDQRKRVLENSQTAAETVALVAAAGVFMGILVGTKMSDAMASAMVSVIPASWGSHMALLSALLSAPGTFFLSNDAFYFGILPALSQTASTYGISIAEMGRAGLLGQPLHGLSPIMPSLYVALALTEVEFSEVLPICLPYYIIANLVFIAAAVLTGAISF